MSWQTSTSLDFTTLLSPLECFKVWARMAMGDSCTNEQSVCDLQNVLRCIICCEDCNYLQNWPFLVSCQVVGLDRDDCPWLYRGQNPQKSRFADLLNNSWELVRQTLENSPNEAILKGASKIICISVYFMDMKLVLNKDCFCKRKGQSFSWGSEIGFASIYTCRV